MTSCARASYSYPPAVYTDRFYRVGDLAAAWDDFRDATDDAVEALGPILAAIAQGILSFFPGIGSVLAAALAAGIALARGRPIEEVIITAAANALPGGPAVQIAFTNAIAVGAKIAKGETLGQIAIDTVNANLGRLPGGPQLQTAFNGVINIARGRDVGDAALALVRQNLPGGAPAQQAFDVTVKIARGQPVADALIQQARALLPPGAAQTAFDTTIAVAKGQPLSKAALDAARAAALANGGQAALDSFNVTLPLSLGATVDAAALKLLRDKTAALGQTALDAFDKSITIATATGLQNAGFGEAATFMPWNPQLPGQTKADAIAWLREGQAHYLGARPLSVDEQAQADKIFDFTRATDRAVKQGETAMTVLLRELFVDLAKLDPAQWDLYPLVVSHLEVNRSPYEHDLQDTEASELAKKYETDVFPWGTAVNETTVRAALGSVPYTIKPPFTGRKDKRRGQADIDANFQRAIPGAKARRAQIQNMLALFRAVDEQLKAGRSVEQVLTWAKAQGFGGAEYALTRDMIFERLHWLAKKGLAKDDFPEWHLLDDPTGKAAATWASEAEFLAAKTLPTAYEYRRRATLETSLAYRELEGVAAGKGKMLLDKAAADLKRAQELEAAEQARQAAYLSSLPLEAQLGALGMQLSALHIGSAPWVTLQARMAELGRQLEAKNTAQAASAAQAAQTMTAVQRAAASARMGQQFAAEAAAAAALATKLEANRQAAAALAASQAQARDVLAKIAAPRRSRAEWVAFYVSAAA
jgi:hypothetical protein